MLAVVKQDQVCRRLMTVPVVGALTALAFRTAVDEPERFANPAAVGAYFGLTPSKCASGETDYTCAGGSTPLAAVRAPPHRRCYPELLVIQFTPYQKLEA